ncbi:hypothetical protein ANO11243_002890 [Dothideomycetidae sp. 11243]|nr:hypothetical protein ANO11243_002890 [fungal sp. No.11243]
MSGEKASCIGLPGQNTGCDQARFAPPRLTTTWTALRIQRWRFKQQCGGMAVRCAGVGANATVTTLSAPERQKGLLRRSNHNLERRESHQRQRPHHRRTVALRSCIGGNASSTVVVQSPASLCESPSTFHHTMPYCSNADACCSSRRADLWEMDLVAAVGVFRPVRNCHHPGGPAYLRCAQAWEGMEFFGVLMELMTGMLTSLNGLGTEQSLLTPEQIGLALEWAWVGTVFWAWCLCFGKLAIIALYIHITSAAVKRERTFLWCVGGVIGAAAIVQTVLIVTTCNPPQKQWFRDIPGECPRRKVALDFDYFQGGE